MPITLTVKLSPHALPTREGNDSINDPEPTPSGHQDAGGCRPLLVGGSRDRHERTDKGSSPRNRAIRCRRREVSGPVVSTPQACPARSYTLVPFGALCSRSCKPHKGGTDGQRLLADRGQRSSPGPSSH